MFFLLNLLINFACLFLADLLRQIESEDSTSNGAANHEHARRRRRTNSGHREIPEPVQKNYTPEQVDAVTK